MEGMQIISADNLFAGEIVYKAREPGEKYYDLPDKYKSGSDLKDYYHVGVVTSVSPLKITHCTTPGNIVVDTKLGKWKYGGRLNGIEYSGKEVVTEMVTLQGGNLNEPINMRASKSTASARIAQIPQGSEVELLEAGTQWSRVCYNDVTGYVLTKFVQSGGDNEPAADGETVLVNRADLEHAYDILGD